MTRSENELDRVSTRNCCRSGKVEHVVVGLLDGAVIDAFEDGERLFDADIDGIVGTNHASVGVAVDIEASDRITEPVASLPSEPPIKGFMPTTRMDSPTLVGLPALVSTASLSINASVACLLVR